MRPIEIRRIDVVDAELRHFAQNGARGARIFGRSPHMRTGQLHGAVAHATHAERRPGKSEAATQFGCTHLQKPPTEKKRPPQPPPGDPDRRPWRFVTKSTFT